MYDNFPKKLTLIILSKRVDKEHNLLSFRFSASASLNFQQHQNSLCFVAGRQYIISIGHE